jgi:heterodisulfide reductase subunit A
MSVEGEPGRFKVKVKKKARSVDPDLCTGCGTCFAGCPVTNQPYPKEARGQ